MHDKEEVSFQTKLDGVYEQPPFSWIIIKLKTFYQAINVTKKNRLFFFLKKKRKKADPSEVFCTLIHPVAEDSIAVVFTLKVLPSLIFKITDKITQFCLLFIQN